MDESVQAQVTVIQGADLVICFPTFNSALTIGHVVRTIGAGLRQSFPGLRAVLINSDAGSTDGSQEEVRKNGDGELKLILTAHAVDPVQKINPPYHGIPGREYALRSAFEITRALQARACAVFDADSSSIAPEWIDAFVRPVYEKGLDCVTPVYGGHRFDRTLTNGIVYPLTRALYGKRVLQMIGRDFAFSGNFAGFCLSRQDWDSDVARFGVDIWATTLAICEGYKVGQSFVGPKILDSKGAGSDLVSLFTQVLSSVYDLMEPYFPFWKNVRDTEPVPSFGRPEPLRTEPVSINVEGMIRNFRLAVANLAEIWRTALSPKSVRSLQTTARARGRPFVFPDDIWAQVVYDFALAYHTRRIHRDHLLKSMIPVYLGWVASFVEENQDRSAEEADAAIETLCRTFEEMKPYLVNQWTMTAGGEPHE
jgi:glucosylglycerate synthase